MKKTAEDKGIKLLAVVYWPSPEDIIIGTTKPVKNLSDIKGMVIRAVSSESSAVLKKWGAGPSFITGAEVYMAMQRGTINGAIMSVINYWERKLYEVAPHAIFLPIMSVHSYIAMNKGFSIDFLLNSKRCTQREQGSSKKILSRCHEDS